MFTRFAFALVVAVAPLAAHADDLVARPGASLAAVEAERAEARLSQRYAQLWSTFDAAARARFAAGERHWLNVTRFEEQSRCVARHSEPSAHIVAACRAAVVERRLGALERFQLASKN